VPVTAVDDLIDRDYGRWAGELEAAVVARFGSLDAVPGGEPQRAVAERSFALLEAQLPALEHGDVVVVSHEAVNKALLTHLDPALDSTLRQRTGCWNETRRNYDRWTVSLADQRPALAMDSQDDGR
jgi:broad specificity phosphatase PhoE